MVVFEYFIGIVCFYICLKLTRVVFEWVKVGVEHLRPRKYREWDKYM